MLRRLRRNRRTLARGLLALLAGGWLAAFAAPCVMAAMDSAPHLSAGDCPPGDTPSNGAMPACDTGAMLDCQLPNPNPPSAAAPDLPAGMPVLLYALPAPEALAAPPSRHDFRYTASASSFPPERRHTVLLI